MDMDELIARLDALIEDIKDETDPRMMDACSILYTLTASLIEGSEDGLAKITTKFSAEILAAWCN
jgi:hypothetical protein